MLKGMPCYREGVDGLLLVILKSRCFFVATSVENQMRVITVVLNADQSHEDDLAIFKTTNQLLQYLLINFQKSS